MTALRKSLQNFAEELQLFSGQLAQQTEELKRNVELRPITGATHFRHCLEDINDRLAAVGEELQALEAVSLDAISLEELVGHCLALYRQNHKAIAQLEQRLQQYGYRDVYAPLPPDNPLDMLLLRQTSPVQSGRMQQHLASPGLSPAPAAAPALQHHRQPLEHITNSLAAASLHDEVPGSVQRPPRTAIKAMAPMTAAKARPRSETPSSLSSSPFEAMSPSMRELLGKYAASTGGPPTSYSGTPFSHSATPPAMAQLTPAFAAAQLASEQQEHASEQQAQQAAVAEQHTPGGDTDHTPDAAGAGTGWLRDTSMYNALTATAKKLANKPDFLEDIRQRFPHIAASTERLLASVEKQQPGSAGPEAGQHLVAGGPGPSRLGPSLGSQPANGRGAWEQEENTMQLYSQVISTRPYPMPAYGLAAGEELQQHAQPEGSITPVHTRPLGVTPAPATTPSTELLLSRALSATSHGAGPLPSSNAHPISALHTRAGAAPSSAAVAGNPAKPQAVGGSAAVPETPTSSVQRPERSRLDLQEAIEAALRRSTVPAAMPAAAPPPAAGLALTCSSAPVASAISAAAAGACSQGSGLAASLQAAGAAPAAGQPVARPLQPATAAAVPSAQEEVPPLRQVTQEDYDSLPSFIRGQLSLEQVNETLAAVHARVSEKVHAGEMPGFTLEDLERLGLGGKSKAWVNSIVKLNRAHLKVVYGQGTVYRLL